jgi:bla regulator protein blaR1
MTWHIALPCACRTLALLAVMPAAMPAAGHVVIAQATPTPPANTDNPTFAVSVVKPSGPDSVRSIKFSPGGRFTARNATVRLLIKIAYDLTDDQLTGGPAWIGVKRFDVDATPDAPDGDVIDQVRDRQRLQGLLADRFQLDLRSEMRMMSTYALVVAKSGPKLKKSQAPDAPTQFHANAGEVLLTSATLDQFANAVSDWVRQPVLNQTGLDGKYDLRLEWTPDQPMATASPTGAPPDQTADSGPTIFTALQQQLGLSLQSRKNQALCKVVDRVQLPSEN